MLPTSLTTGLEQRVRAALLLLSATSRLVCTSDICSVLQATQDDVTYIMHTLRAEGLVFSASRELYWVTQVLLDQETAPAG